jgi:hypothetical protein
MKDLLDKTCTVFADHRTNPVKRIVELSKEKRDARTLLQAIQKEFPRNYSHLVYYGHVFKRKYKISIVDDTVPARKYLRGARRQTYDITFDRLVTYDQLVRCLEHISWKRWVSDIKLVAVIQIYLLFHPDVTPG